MRTCLLGSLSQSRLEGFRCCCADSTAQRPPPRARQRYQIEEWTAAPLFRSRSTFVLKDGRHFSSFHDDRAKPDSFPDSRSHGWGAVQAGDIANLWTKL